MPRCMRCQSLAQPSSAEYWHIGETTMRLASSSPATRKGVNKVLDMGFIRLWLEARQSPLLDGFQIDDDGIDILGVKLEFRHVRMARHDALAKRLFQGLDRITLPEGSERRRKLVWAFALSADPLARCTIFHKQFFAMPDALRKDRVNRRHDGHDCDTGDATKFLHNASIDRTQRRMRSLLASSPTMPRRNRRTQATKIAPWMTSTHSPIGASLNCITRITNAPTM